MSIECREPQATLRRTIEDVLSDAPRAGAHGKFSAEQMTQIMAVACESPEQSGRPVDHWTHRELADEAKQRGIVLSISPFRSDAISRSLIFSRIAASTG